MRVYIKREVFGEESYWRAKVSRAWAKKNDNGHMVSIGLHCPNDITRGQLGCLIRSGKAEECSFDEWNHSGCQSACRRRGNSECRW